MTTPSRKRDRDPGLAPGPLTEFDNVVVVPHVASATPTTRLRMGEIVVTNIRNVLTAGSPKPA
jgi:lactate dehydrogenase-like 2-hydroxyacid dehydrogenase